MAVKKHKSRVTITAEVPDITGEVEAAIAGCIRSAVHDAIFNAIKADVRQAFLASPLKDKMLPKIVDETLKRMAREAE